MDMPVKTEKSQEQKTQALEKLRPSQMLRPFEDMERAFERMFSRAWPSPFRWGEPLIPELPETFMAKWPRIDIIDRDHELVLRAEIPGLSKDDLDISLTEDTVTISGKARKEEKTEEGEYYCAEIVQGEFCRSISLPAGIDGSQATAKFKDGMLEMTLPKLEKSVRHTVKIEEG